MTEPIAVVLSQHQWRVVQEALDAQYYATEHERTRGIRAGHREAERLRREERLRILVEADRQIGAATGPGPLFG